MIIKSKKNLVETVTPAHSLVVEDDNGDPIMVAVSLDVGIMCATIGDPQFEQTLRYAGVEKMPKIFVAETRRT
jgi:hypothetical protein